MVALACRRMVAVALLFCWDGFFSCSLCFVLDGFLVLLGFAVAIVHSHGFRASFVDASLRAFFVVCCAFSPRLTARLQFSVPVAVLDVGLSVFFVCGLARDRHLTSLVFELGFSFV